MPSEQEVLIDIRERLVRVETKLDNQNDLRGKVEDVETEVQDVRTKVTENEARSKSNTHRIDSLEANLTWLWRTVAGALIAAGVGALFAVLK